VLSPRTMVDRGCLYKSRCRLRDAKAMLYRPRADIVAVPLPTATMPGEAQRRLRGRRDGASHARWRWAADSCSAHGRATHRIAVCYTLDEDPMTFYGSFCLDVVQGFGCRRTKHALRSARHPAATRVTWPAEAGRCAGALSRGPSTPSTSGCLPRLEERSVPISAGTAMHPRCLFKVPPEPGRATLRPSRLARLQEPIGRRPRPARVRLLQDGSTRVQSMVVWPQQLPSCTTSGPTPVVRPLPTLPQSNHFCPPFVSEDVGPIFLVLCGRDRCVKACLCITSIELLM